MTSATVEPATQKERLLEEMASYESVTNTLQILQLVASIFAAIGTVAVSFDSGCCGTRSLITSVNVQIAALAKVYQIRADEVEAVNRKRRMIEESASKVNPVFATLFFRSRLLLDRSGINTRPLQGGDVENAFSEANYVFNDAAEVRVAVEQFIESLRSCAHVFAKVMPKSDIDKIGSDIGRKVMGLDNIWIGQYDPITSPLRTGCLEFARYYHFDKDGIMEKKQAYFRKIIGTEEEWNKICALIELFVPEELYLDPKRSKKPESGIMSVISVRAE